MSATSPNKSSPSQNWPLPSDGVSIYVPDAFLQDPPTERWASPSDSQDVWIPDIFRPAPPGPAQSSQQALSALLKGNDHRCKLDLMTCPICDVHVCDMPKLSDFIYHITDNHRPAKVLNDKGKLVHVYKETCFISGCSCQICWVPKPWHLRSHIHEGLKQMLRDEIDAFWPPSKPKAKRPMSTGAAEQEGSARKSKRVTIQD
ncbi:uncharacterized protein PFL1_01966 [Pseudozyma flocculosa PF-1]|uniref:Uncharacterized protein n=1 Tax=Pseudozyma flocculosa TaxID=84751 RepID=A0A5C3F1C5_9BASI|nr:uncharacterized protein PFL1_01966 [Pseudozyma flocculosa PF-1]EPQ30440.1 hypothetical protein PFL1_01966 [Pseudozyma flocculosa PF-1]SPO37517.1 uncharacterized protein PSFLO_02992 [Pseudozyma flocculosa]